jgi:hypothetical protein
MTPTGALKAEKSPPVCALKATPADVISLSGCKDGQRSADTFAGAVAVGATSRVRGTIPLPLTPVVRPPGAREVGSLILLTPADRHSSKTSVRHVYPEMPRS